MSLCTPTLWPKIVELQSIQIWQLPTIQTITTIGSQKYILTKLKFDSGQIFLFVYGNIEYDKPDVKPD